MPVSSAAPPKPAKLKAPFGWCRGFCPRCHLETVWRGFALDRPPCSAEGCGYRPQSRSSIERTDARIARQYKAENTPEIL